MICSSVFSGLMLIPSSIFFISLLYSLALVGYFFVFSISWLHSHSVHLLFSPVRCASLWLLWNSLVGRLLNSICLVIFSEVLSYSFVGSIFLSPYFFWLSVFVSLHWVGQLGIWSWRWWAYVESILQSQKYNTHQSPEPGATWVSPVWATCILPPWLGCNPCEHAGRWSWPLSLLAKRPSYDC